MCPRAQKGQGHWESSYSHGKWKWVTSLFLSCDSCGTQLTELLLSGDRVTGQVVVPTCKLHQLGGWSLPELCNSRPCQRKGSNTKAVGDKRLYLVTTSIVTHPYLAVPLPRPQNFKMAAATWFGLNGTEHFDGFMYAYLFWVYFFVNYLLNLFLFLFLLLDLHNFYLEYLLR